MWHLIVWSSLLLAAIAAVGAGPEGPAAQTHRRLVELQPRVRDPHTLARLIVRGANLAGVEPRVLVAIAFQESSLIPQTRWYSDDHADIGLFQVNSRTARDYGCNLAKLLAYEPEESVRCAAVVLRRKRAVCLAQGVEAPVAVACFHSYTPRHRDAYFARLRRWL